MPNRVNRLFNPFAAFEAYCGFEGSVPDIIEFIISDKYLDRPNLYPRQATFLKVLFLQDELLTDYDFDVIDEWTENYSDSTDQNGLGYDGIVPDVLDRIKICKDQGRKWFRESVVAVGRRGSKGHMGALAGAYVLWNYISKGDPQEYYGIDRDKKLAMLVFGGKKEQAKANQWADLYNVILGAPCFEPYISRALAESLTVFAPHDFAKMHQAEVKGQEQGKDPATFEILPKESTPLAGRGPAVFSLYFDEMAHVVKAVAKSDAKDVYDSSTPATDTFGKDAFLYEPSSTWQKMGQFYENYLRSLEKLEDGSPAYPEMLMLHLDSWSIYRDWGLTSDPSLGLVARPWSKRYVPVSSGLPEPSESHQDGSPALREEVVRSIPFKPLKGAIQEFGPEMEKLERANPETFAVERRSRWAASLMPYLNPGRIAAMWLPWPTEDRPMVMQHRGILSISYRGHGDPSQSGKNFGFSIAHVEYHPLRQEMLRRAQAESGFRPPAEYILPHVVFDVIHAWRPGDFPDNNFEIDYDFIEGALKDYLDAFILSELTFDQYPMGSTINHLRQHAARKRYPKRVEIYERDATNPLNWKTYEAFKTALGLSLIHAPYHQLAAEELEFLQDTGKKKVEHPTSGPIQTKDISDCYHPDTEVLTINGWRKISEVKKGDVVATRDIDGVLEYQPVSARIERHHAGELYEFRGRDVAFSVTPTHNMLVYSRKGISDWTQDPSLIPVRSLDRPTWIPRTAVIEDRVSTWIDIDSVDRSVAMERRVGRGGDRSKSKWSDEEETYLRENYSISSMVDLCAVLGRRRSAIYGRARDLKLVRGQIGDRIADWPDPLPKTSRVEFARFLGIWLAEGSTVARSKGYRIRVHQKKENGVIWINSLFDRLGWPVDKVFDERRGWTWIVKSQGLRSYLRSCEDEHERSIPNEVFESWSQMEMLALLEGLCVGDGCFAERDQRFISYSSISRRLIDDVQRLLAHVGLVGNIRVADLAPGDESRNGRFHSKHDQLSVQINASTKAPGFRLDPSKIVRVPYSGPVHCLTVPNHTLLVRLDGKPMWCGNCLSINVYELIGEAVMSYAEQLSNFGLHGMQPGGIEPFSNMTTADSEVDAAFSDFRSGRRRREVMGMPSRPRGPRA